MPTQEGKFNTIAINLVAGPGAGKSTYAAGLFYRLKIDGIESELVREYAKDRAWLGDKATLGNQVYVTGKQFFRQDAVMGQVQVVVTDSPIILGLIYGSPHVDKNFEQWTLDTYDKFNNLTVLLKRSNENHPYVPRGRLQSYEEAMVKDKEIEDVLVKYGINYVSIAVDKHNTLDVLHKLTLVKLYEDTKAYLEYDVDNIWGINLVSLATVCANKWAIYKATAAGTAGDEYDKLLLSLLQDHDQLKLLTARTVTWEDVVALTDDASNNILAPRYSNRKFQYIRVK